VKKDRKSEKPTMVATKLDHGFENHDEFKDAVNTASEEGIKKAESHLQRIAKIFGEFDAEGIVAVVCTYGSTQIDHGENTNSNGMIDGIEQYHLELLLNLYANFGLKRSAVNPVTPAVLQEVIDILKDLGATFLFYRMRSGVKHGKVDRAKDTLLERARMHTQAVRNWAYFGGVNHTLSNLFGVDDSIFTQFHGFKPGEVLTVFNYFMDNSENAIAHRMKTIANIAKGRRPIDIFRRYFKFVPNLDGTPEELLDLVGTEGDRSHALAMVMAHYDLQIPSQIAVSLDILVEETGLAKASVEKIFEKFTIQSDYRETYNLERVFLSNEVWLKPLINSDEYGVICPIPMLFFSHSFRILDNLYFDAGRQEKLARVRSEFLESEVENLAHRAFKSGRVLSNAQWTWEGVNYETDLLVQVDSAIIVVEAKSHHLKDAALRGAENALKRNVRQIIGHSSEQSQRLKKIMELAKGDHSEARKVCDQIGLTVDKSTFIIRISVSLDDLSFLNGSEALLREVGWIKDDVHLAPYISIHDLQVVFDVLDSELHILHFLNERQYLERLGEILGDEIDLLGVYLDNLFNFSGPDENALTIFTGMSSPVDAHYLAGARRPKPKVHPFIRPIVHQIMTRKRKGWLLFAMSLLSAASWSEFGSISRALKALAKKVRKSGGNLKNDFSLQIIPPETHRPVVLLSLYRAKWREKVRSVILDLAAQAVDGNDHDTCVVICKDVDSKQAADAFYFVYVE
tara:strand:+ start:379 stop:2598 length:2220 start_codon:yes stop_codon:yes gene_type:complete